MAYPRTRRSSGGQPRQPSLDATDSEEFAPPRPFFLAGNSGQRSSGSSFDTTSLEPASDSDKDSPPEQPPPPPKPRPSTLGRKRRSLEQWDPNTLYNEPENSTPPAGSSLFHRSSRPPPSSFAFPFQAYAGNPDPGLPIPGRRRSSLDSAVPAHLAADLPTKSFSVDDHTLRSGSLHDLRRPFAPFMAGDPNGEGSASSSTGSLPRVASSNSLFKQSAAANMMPAQGAPAAIVAAEASIPRNSSTHSFRTPHLAPPSRPGSSLWSPPSYNTQLVTSAGTMVGSPTASTTALPNSPSPYATVISKSKPPLPSTRLATKLEKEDKPWLHKPEPGTRFSYFLTLFCIFLGFAGSVVLCFLGWNDVHLIDESRLCPVLDEQFSSASLDESTWNYDVQLGGFGNGEFQMTTKDPDNLFLYDGNLYINPTLTSDKVKGVMDGGNFTLGDDCTVKSTNRTACSATSNASRGTVINPVMSARINTQGKKSMRFGKVEVRAKLPTGDWLWPAVWMLPEADTYGAWPASGEIDILEARGNGPSYPFQGNNFVRASLNYGPMPAVFNMIFGWWSNKRVPFSRGWHTYVLEWDEKVVRVWVDSRMQRMLEVKIGSGHRPTFWDKAGFPKTAKNGSAEVVVENPYQPRGDGSGAGSPAAPFDQKFYLIVDLAVGGTSGWFPDGKGGKPWFDGSLTAMRDFARAQDTWYATWPQATEDRAFRIDYIKMWEKC